MADNLTDKAKETARSVSDQARELSHQGTQSLTECIDENPGSAIMVAFGAGLGLGLVVASLLAEPPRRRRRWYDVDTAQRFGHQVLDSISDLVPDAIARKMR